MKTFIYLIACLLVSQCGETFHMIRIRNNSENKVSFFSAFPHSYLHAYPDTTLHKENDVFVSFGDIMPFAGTSTGGSRSWESKFEEIPSDTLSFYFFHSDTLAKYPWEEIRKDYKVLKRYDLSIEDIQMLDYEITYPPTMAMKDIKMYPPYNK